MPEHAGYPSVSLAALLRLRSPDVSVVSSEAYLFGGVRSFGGGVFRSGIKRGSEFAYRQLTKLRAGDFVYPKLMAWEGALAVVPEDAEGLVVSPEFCVFDVDRSRVIPSWLGYYFMQPSILPTLSGGSAGTNIRRRRLYPQDFLQHSVPLPSVEEQARVLAVVGRMASQLHAAEALAAGLDGATKKLRQAQVRRVFARAAEASVVPFGDLITRSRSLRSLEPAVEYAGIGTRMWGEGAYIHERRLGKDFNAERYAVAPGQLVYNEVWAHKGAIAVVGSVPDHSVVSRHFHVFDVDWVRVRPAFLNWFFRSPSFWAQCTAGSVGTSGRGHMRRRHLEQVAVPLPDVSIQDRIVAEMDHLARNLASLEELQTARQRELEVLLPSILARAFDGQLVVS